MFKKKKPTQIAIRRALKTIMGFSLSAKQEEMQRCFIKISGMQENSLEKPMKQVSPKEFSK